MAEKEDEKRTADMLAPSQGEIKEGGCASCTAHLAELVTERVARRRAEENIKILEAQIQDLKADVDTWKAGHECLESFPGRLKEEKKKHACLKEVSSEQAVTIAEQSTTISKQDASISVKTTTTTITEQAATIADQTATMTAQVTRIFAQDTTITEQIGTIAPLQADLSAGKEELARMEVGTQVWQAIRARQMERYKVSHWKEKRWIQSKQRYVAEKYRSKKSILDAGHSAAHHAIGEADALFCLLSNEQAVKNLKQSTSPKPGYKSESTKIFEDMYHYAPKKFLELPGKLREAVNLEVTIRTVEVMNETLERPLKERTSAFDHATYIRETYPKFASNEAFSSDPEINRRLAILRNFANIIVAGDRKEGGMKNSRSGS